ncbi:hypothetical protein PHPALM_28385 [Phytophthora palmivora]|uniref:Uncharacterized protein n=1 Tax=Phytophthora palmivora TaxID=4796 RepID=A0A2P4XA76_9STRA|nr:hypothetical protein PHPALM_28385 [Phytophthora palmivora]
MPLFDAIESDVAAFFVSQGTVFDALVKAIMDRMASVESSVALLRSDVTNNFNLVNQRIDATNVAIAEASAATAATVATAATAAASAALASLPMADYASPTPQVVTVVDPGGGRNEELEYYVMTLSRQLNMVLEVLFQPHGNNNVVEVVQAKQTEMNSISDVLTENETILMQLAAHADIHPIQDPDHGKGNVGRRTDSQETNIQTAQPVASVQQPETSSPSLEIAEAVPHTANVVVQPELLNKVAETIDPRVDATPLAKKDDVVKTVNSSPPDNQKSGQVPDRQDDDGDEGRDQISVDSSHFRLQTSNHESSLHRKKSFYRGCQDLQRQEDARLREQRRREEEMMRRMHELLLQSRSQIQQHHVEEWRQQQNEVTQNQQSLIYHLQGQLQEQLQAQQRQVQEWRREQELEWRREQEQQQSAGMTAIQQEVDRKLEAFKSLMATAQATQAHECAETVNLIGDFEKKFVTPGALEAAGALWLKTAADNCIYGANPDTLSTLLQNFLSFKTQLNAHSVKSPAITLLHEALDRAIQLLQQPLPSSDDMVKGSEQENSMYTLRQLLAKVDTLYRTASAEHEEFPLPEVGFLSEAIHRMELGTANLLDAVDFQREHFQQTLVQHQTGLEKLQNELWRQQEVEKALKTQLSGCPSKEDTLRLVQDLRDQVTATTTDSASRMLDTVDDLRYRITSLPNTQVLEQLSLDLHAKTDRITHEIDATTVKLSHDLRQKADRVEIDRLQSLLESSNGTIPPPAYLTKSPLKCLSCDQHLPFAQAPPEDKSFPEQAFNPGYPITQRPGSPPRSPLSSPPRPIVYHNQQYSQQQPYPYQQHPESADFDNDLGINMGILEELFTASTSALERRRRRRHHLQMQLLSPQTDASNEWFTRKSTFLNIDDSRNRIPLRKTQLSERVIYGPAITPNAFRKKQFGRSDEYVGLRDKIDNIYMNLPTDCVVDDRRPLRFWKEVLEGKS